jgi:hypothetical protein
VHWHPDIWHKYSFGNRRVSAEFSVLSAVMFAYDVVDDSLGRSNCVVVNVVAPPALTINGSTGPVAVAVSSTMDVAGTGFVPEIYVTTHRYTGPSCGGASSSSFSWPTSGSGTISGTVEAPDRPGTYSYRTDDAVGGVTNCVIVNVTAPPPVIAINGSAGPVSVTSSSPLEIQGTGFSVDIYVTTYRYDGSSCGGASTNSYAWPSDRTGAIGDTAPGIDTPGTYSFQTEDALRGLSNCVIVNVVAPAPTETPTPTTTPTETSTATETPGATATATSDVALPGGAVVTVVTSDGSAIPDDTIVCLADACQSLDEIAAAAAPSGTQVTFTGFAPGSYPLTVFVGVAQVHDGTVEIASGETSAITITLSAAAPTVGPGTPDPGIVGPGEGDDNDDGRDGGEGNGGDSGGGSGSGAGGSAVVTTLPGTGTGGSPSFSAWLILLVSAALIAVAAVTAVGRRKTRE